VKAEIYAHVDAKREEAREIRMANGGYDTPESIALEKEADKLQKNAMILDIAAMAVFTGPDLSDALIGQTVTQIDLVHRAATADSKIMLQRCDAAGQNCTKKEVSLEEVTIVDGKIYVFNNGIFNGEDKALANGARQSGDVANDAGVYHILNPETGSYVAEILYAGYDKLNDALGGRLPLTNAEKMNQEFILRATDQGGVVSSVNHSRGSMTWINAIGNMQQQGGADLGIGNVYFFGAAANAQESADIGYVISGGNSMQYQATHATDLVGKVPWILGGNPPTGEKNGGKFPASHSAYTQSAPPVGTFIGGINMRELTDRTWGPGKYSEPVQVPPSEKAKANLELQKGGK
jgi:filamentous hemagglutinin